MSDRNGQHQADTFPFVWDDVALQYVRMTQPSTASGSASTQVSVSNFSTQVSVSGYSTQVTLGTNPSVAQASSVWQIQAGSTNWPKAAGLSVDSSNVQNVKLDGSTRINLGSTAADNAVLATPMSTAFVKSAGFSVDSSNVQNVKLDGSTRINLGSTAADNAVTATPVSTAYVKSAGFFVDTSNALSMKLDGSTVVTVQPLGGSTFNVRALNSSAADFQVTATPVSGSTWNVRALNSSAADLQMTATPAAGSTFNVRALCSSAGDFMNKSWNFDSTGGGLIGSTKAVQVGVNGMIVREGSVNSTSVGVTWAAAGDVSLISSVAAQSIYVYALMLQGGVGNSTAAQTAGSSFAVYRLQSGTTGATLWRWTFQPSTLSAPFYAGEVTPPHYLFKTAAAANLNLNATSSGGNVCVAAWLE